MKKAALALAGILALVVFRSVILRIGANFRQRVREIATECSRMAAHCRRMLSSSEAGVR